LKRTPIPPEYPNKKARAFLASDGDNATADRQDTDRQLVKSDSCGKDEGRHIESGGEHIEGGGHNKRDGNGGHSGNGNVAHNERNDESGFSDQSCSKIAPAEADATLQNTLDGRSSTGATSRSASYAHLTYSSETTS
jgi:hypothetical protein